MQDNNVVVINSSTEISTDVRKHCQQIGDKLFHQHAQNNDLKSAQGAIMAYSAAIKIAMAQLVYKKLTGNPGRIEFFEEPEQKTIKPRTTKRLQKVA